MPERGPPGVRGRIGIIQPAPGVMIEHEWPHWLPRDMLFPVARIAMTSATAAGYADLAGAAPQAARDLASAGAGLVAYACTIGSLFAGVAAETALVEALARAAGCPAISLAATSMRAIARVGGSRLAIMTPYSVETNRWVADYVEACGLAVDSFIATPVDIVTVGNLQPAEIAALAIRAMAARPNADALWIPCTAIQTMAAIAEIEAATARPVISGTQALLWDALRILDVRDPVQGAGRLFA